jgi:hypothetical protein
MPTNITDIGDDINTALERITEVFHRRSIRYALIGGIATNIRGRVRLTIDVDFLLDVPQIALPGLLEELLENGFELDPLVVIKEYVQQSMTAIRFGSTTIDWLKPVLPIYTRTLNEASMTPWSDTHQVRTAIAEGLILTKMLAFRPQDQTDIETLLIANREDIDLSIIRDEWAAFAKSEAERTAWLEAAIAKHVTPYRES